MLNTYETLVTYNGTSNTSFVPVLATCVPGTPQCLTDYGSTLIYQADGNQYTGVTGEPIYWTFVIDGGAKFYDPSHAKSWGVYPTDVMFSEARYLGWSELIGVGSTAGWLTAQALLPNGQYTYDQGLHAPYNTTPGDILSSMLINDTAYCPAAAITNEHGCITFMANGGASDWPFFLQLIGDGFAGAVTPCGWFTAQSAGIPGWSGSSAAYGDGPCKVPQLGHTQSTSSPAWASYIGNLTNPLNTNPNTNATSWDSFEEELFNYPAPQPNVQWNMVGSGPYYAHITPASNPPGYTLTASPAYAQPAGCSGAGGVAKYSDSPGCFPAASGYIQKVQVYYESSDSVGINEYRAGQADFAGIETPEIGTMLELQSEGKLNYLTAPGISTFFLPINLAWDSTSYSSDSLPGADTPNVAPDFFSGQAARSLLTESYPYSEAETTAWTVDNIPTLYEAGGPIAKGMDYYPSNVSFPYTQNGGNPDTNANDVGSAAWWWTQGISPTSPYYDPELAACVTSTCTFDLVGELGDPGLDTAISEWIPIIESITSNHVQPYTFDLPFGGEGSLISDQLVATAGQGPLTVWNLGWAPDNFAPEDYMLPMAFPNSTYTLGDAVWQQFNNPTYDDVGACGHATATSYSNLIYWYHQTTLTQACEGVAYDVATYWNEEATHVANPTQQGLDYNMVDGILNSLALYIWYGQATQITSFAPWISGSSININPAVGGGGDQFWFMIQYAAIQSSVEFKETGLPSSAPWSVTVGANTFHNTTIVAGHASAGYVTFIHPNGTISFSISAPSGYGVAKITGPLTPTFTSANVSGDTTLTVHFGAIEKVYFNESILAPHWTGLPSGTVWSVVLSPAGHGGPAGQMASNTTTAIGGSIEFALTAGAHYKFHVVKPANYKESGAFRGGLSVPKRTLEKLVKFTLYSSTVSFVEHGLPGHTAWSVNIAGPINEVISGSTSTLKAYLTNGTYTYTIPAVGSATGTGTPASPITVTAPHGLSVHVTFTGAHASFGSTPVSRGTSAIVSHTNLVATVSGREAA